jgi:hypothetical protein
VTARSKSQISSQTFFLPRSEEFSSEPCESRHPNGSAVSGVKRGGSSAVVTSGDPGNPTFLDVRHQCGPE